MGHVPLRAGRRCDRSRTRIAIFLVIVVLVAVVAVGWLAGPYAVAAMSPVLSQLNRLVRTITQS